MRWFYYQKYLQISFIKTLSYLKLGNGELWTGHNIVILSLNRPSIVRLLSPVVSFGMTELTGSKNNFYIFHFWFVLLLFDVWMLGLSICHFIFCSKYMNWKLCSHKKGIPNSQISYKSNINQCVLSTIKFKLLLFT